MKIVGIVFHPVRDEAVAYTAELEKFLNDQIKESVKNVIPLKRFGLPQEIAAAVAFLAGPDAGYITGQVLCVDGGMVM